MSSVESTIPEAIGRYQIESRLGSGGMAEIFVAKKDDAATQVVVKRLLPHLTSNQRYVSMFKREGNVAVTLQHPNVIKTFELGFDNTVPFLAMEYINGLTLKEYCVRRWLMGEPVPVEDIAQVVHEVALALDHIHNKEETGQQGLIHRDVSPENIMIGLDGAVKLLDFGIARLQGGDGLTQTGELKGKIPYMSPEQVRGTELTSATDIFSLGSTMYWSVCQKRPFDRSSDLATINAIVDETPDFPQPFGQRVPSTFLRAMAHMLEKEPRHRPERGQVIATMLSPHLAADAHGLRNRVAVAQGKDIEALKKAWGTDEDGEVNLAQGEATMTTAETVSWRNRFQSEPKPAVVAQAGPQGQRRSLALGLLAICSLAFVVAAVVFGTSILRDEGAPRVISVDAKQAPPVAWTSRPLLSVQTPEPAATPEPSEPTKKPTENAPQRLRTVKLIGSEISKWTHGGKRLDVRSGKAKLTPRVSTITGVHKTMGSYHRVPIVGGVADFSSIPLGTVQFRVVPYGLVSIGEKSLGTTPLRPISLPAGTYKVKLEYNGSVQTKTLSVVGGRTVRLKAQFGASSK